jgi:PAS domain S-box-containing protein
MFYLPEDREAGVPARSIATAREKGKFEAEGWRLRKDGTKFLASVVIDAIYEDGELIGFAKITRDITERNKHSEALKESERHFRLLVNGVTDYALYMLDPNGIVTNWNAGGQRIKGYSPEEIIGQHFSRFYSPADQAAGRPARALRLAQENGRYEEGRLAGAARTARSFGPASSSTRFVTMTTSCSALPRSHAIFPSVAKPS